MASDYEVKDQEFEKYAINTIKLFVSLYPWFYMPPTVHKILIHGADVIRTSILSIIYCYIIFKFYLV
jgi:hypothetical protein